MNGEDLYAQILTGLRDTAIFALDRAGQIVMWNRGAQLISGYDEAEVMGQSYRVFGSHDTDADVARVLQTAQTSLCNAHHPVEQRLCRWLLQTLDRVPTRELRITHDLIATLLGVRREAVTLAAHRLQARKAISCSRGQITVLDRRLLETLSCECYALLKNDTELLVREIGGPPSNGSQAK